MGYNARNGRKQQIELLLLLLLLLFLLHFLQPLAVSYTRHVTYLAELEPPARYNHPYNGPVIERVMPLAELHKICGYDGALVRGSLTAHATWFCQAIMDRLPFLFTAAMKRLIAMAGRKIIRKM